MTNRRTFLKSSSMMLAAGGLFGFGPRRLIGHPGHGETDTNIIGHNTHRYRVNRAWGNLNPKQYPIINCHAMAQSESGLLYTLTDVKSNNIIVYQPDGTFVEAMDLEYSGGHGIEISKEGGEEFLYIADGGWANRYGRKVSNETGRIAKTDLAGRLIYSIGHPQTIGVYQPGQKFKPCDIAVAPNGDLYVSDGYGSQNMLHYNQHGQYIRHWGGADDPDERARLNGAHGVSIDLRNPNNPVVLATSRSESKIKKFTLDGKYLGEIHLPGALAGQLVVKGRHAYAGVCWSRDPGVNKNKLNSGFVVVLDENDKVVSCPGGDEPIYENGQLRHLRQAADSPFKHVHDLCVDRDDNVYACQWNSDGEYPIKLERV